MKDVSGWSNKVVPGVTVAFRCFFSLNEHYRRLVWYCVLHNRVCAAFIILLLADGFCQSDYSVQRPAATSSVTGAKIPENKSQLKSCDDGKRKERCLSYLPYIAVVLHSFQRKLRCHQLSDG